MNQRSVVAQQEIKNISYITGSLNKKINRIIEAGFHGELHEETFFASRFLKKSLF